MQTIARNELKIDGLIIWYVSTARARQWTRELPVREPKAGPYVYHTKTFEELLNYLYASTCSAINNMIRDGMARTERNIHSERRRVEKRPNQVASRDMTFVLPIILVMSDFFPNRAAYKQCLV